MRSPVPWVLAAASVVVTGRAPAADLRLATYNTEGLGAPGSSAYVTLSEILARIDADVVMLQEINPEDVAQVGALAAELDYPFDCVSTVSGTLSGGLHTAALSRFPLDACLSWSAAELSGDPQANDITRDIFEVHVDVDGLAPWGIFTVHLKAGGTDTDKFRRQVELARVTKALERFHLLHPGSPRVLTGDHNEDIGDGPFGSPTFFVLPPGLPQTYHLGSDITFPVTYDPFVTLAADGVHPLDAFHEDEPTDDSTRWVSGRRLDYLIADPHVVKLGTEVYDACNDNNVDDPPPGYWLPKAGFPLPCGTEKVPSDHLAVFGDLDRAALDQDGDGIDDGADCAALDPDAGTPALVFGLVAAKLGSSSVQFTWSAVQTADVYDLIGDLLPASDVAAAPCRTSEDPDPTDTTFVDGSLPDSGTGVYLLVRGVDLACGGAGSYASGFPHEEPRVNDACGGAALP